MCSARGTHRAPCRRKGLRPRVPFAVAVWPASDWPSDLALAGTQFLHLGSEGR